MLLKIPFFVIWEVYRQSRQTSTKILQSIRDDNSSTNPISLVPSMVLQPRNLWLNRMYIQNLGRFHKLFPEIEILIIKKWKLEFLLSFIHLYQACLFVWHVFGFDFVSFWSVHFNFRVPERYAYLSGSWKLKLAKPKVQGTPTVGSISTQRDLYRGDSLVPIHHLPVPGGKCWMGTTEKI